MRKKTRRAGGLEAPAKSQVEGTRARFGSHTRIWFRLAALASPLALLIGVEIVLRLAGFGYPTNFLLERQIHGTAMLVDNPQFGRRFFPPGLVRDPLPLTLPTLKPPGTIRIFVLGESAAMGDPDFKFGLPKMLGALMRERFPQRKFEIINAAMVAISSPVVLSIARDCAAHQGDLWVVYMGNNEQVGPFGSASIFGARAPSLPVIRAGLWLKTTRVGQLLDEALNRLRSKSQPLPEWTGMEMMANQRVRPESAATQAIHSHFRRNLRDLLDVADHAGAKVVLCTVATNLKDCAPFASLHRQGLTPEALADWERLYAEAIAQQAQGNLPEALAKYGQAAAIDDGFAELSFRQAECCSLLQKELEADRLFRKARDEDALQFRADDEINAIIRQASAARDTHQLHLVDADQVFARQSPHRLVGAELFYEHVHLLPEGNYLLAREVAEQAAQLLELNTAGPWLSQTECLKQLGFTDWNRFDDWNVIYDRIQRAPFTNQLNHARQVQQIRERMEQYRSATKPARLGNMAAEVSQVVNRFPDDPDLRWNLAALMQSAGDTSGAEQQWRELIELQPSSALPAFNLGSLLETLNRPSEALECYGQSLRIRADYYPAQLALGALCLRLGDYPRALKCLAQAVNQKPASIAARLDLAQALLGSQKPSQAEQQFREVLRLDPYNQAALRGLDAMAGGPATKRTPAA
ncbi:MAG: tetratricopeptide repeat protein [Limisphaerales bacterium]